MGRLVNIRASERRNTWAAFSVLLVLIASHSILETARDALFLASIPATQLPWVYIAIAAISLVITQLQARLGANLSGRSALALWTGVAAIVTALFWLLGAGLGIAGLYALYIWSGVLTTLVLVHFWILLGDLFSVSQAKRIYGLIGAGSVIGAIVGTAIAGAISTVVAANNLVLCAAVGLAIATALPFLFRAGKRGLEHEKRIVESFAASARFVASKPYASRLALLLLAAAATVTVADFLFKATVAATIEPEKLSTFFASVYLVLNILSLGAQLFVVSWLVRRFNISSALSVLPALLAIGGSIMLVSVGIVAALAIKGADGSLRYSLHRTSTELLFVPLSSEARRRIKAFIDVVSQRGGQALASVVILGATAIGLGPRFLAGLLLTLAIGWIALALNLHRHYLDLFRRRLDRSASARLAEFPSLDIGSLETLIAALDSADDREVLAALDVLDREGKLRLVPALILYHPTDAVVVRALELFAASGRKSIVPLCDRICQTHQSADVRAKAVATRAMLEFNEEVLRGMLDSEDSVLVRTTIMVNLIVAKAIVGEEAEREINAILSGPSDTAKQALAEAIGWRRASHLCYVVAELAEREDAATRQAAARALAALGNGGDLDRLVDLLADESSRQVVRLGLLDNEEDGLVALERALDDQSRPRAVRWYVPPAMAQFEPSRVAAKLLASLPDENDGMVRYRTIRALETLVQRDGQVKLDSYLLDEAINNTIGRCYRYLDRRLTLETAASDEARQTPGFELLRSMLADKEQNAVDRLFRLLGLAHRDEDFNSIYRGITSDNSELLANGLELIENTVKPSLRAAVAGLVDEIDDRVRLTIGVNFHLPADLSYEELLESMLNSSSDTVQDLTAYHIGELHLTRFQRKIDEMVKESESGRDDLVRVAGLLAANPAVVQVTTIAPRGDH